MIEAFVYWLLQTLGYRLFYYDRAFVNGIRLDHYSSWAWLPRKPKGTYRETCMGYAHVGYGIDK